MKLIYWIFVITLSLSVGLTAFVFCFWLSFGLTFGNPHGWWANGFGHALNVTLSIGIPIVAFIITFRHLTKNRTK